jgi:hypothetical protein
VNVRVLLTAITLPLLVSGCASFGGLFGSSVKPIEVQTKAQERTRLNLPDPAPFQAREVEWIIITPENAPQVWARLKEKGDDTALFAITDNGYEALALTIAELRSLIAQQRAVIIKYKEYYEPKEAEKK